MSRRKTIKPKIVREIKVGVYFRPTRRANRTIFVPTANVYLWIRSHSND